MSRSAHVHNDRIRLTGLSARGYHGVFPSEREEGQLFSIDLTLDLGPRGTAVAAQTDCLDDAVDYSCVAREVVDVIAGEPVALIETLAERVADVALGHPRVRAVEVTVHKPQAPLDVPFDDVTVSIAREASDAELMAPAPPAQEERAEDLAVSGTASQAAQEPATDLAAEAVPALEEPSASSAEVLGEQETEPASELTDEPGPEPVPVVDLLDTRPQASRSAGVVIALGGNVGGVVTALRQAVATLRQSEGIEVLQVAPLARTAAVLQEGGAEQPDYLNTIVLASTTLSPREVLGVCQGLETAAGRVRTEPKGPRTLDADLIAYEGVTSTDPSLTLPHPGATQRAFVLVPWSQADPFAELEGRSVAELAEEAPDRQGVRWLALDWIDSDHLPALPTGQYVAPPADPETPAPAPGEDLVASGRRALAPSPEMPAPAPEPLAPAPELPAPAPEPYGQDF